MNKINPGYKETKIGMIPNSWDIIKLKQLSEITAGGTPSTSIKEYWNGNIPWMNSGELNLRRVYDVEGRITKQGLKNSSTKVIPRQSVLIGLAGQGRTRATVAINEIDLCTNQSVAAIIPDKEQSCYLYLFYYLDSQYDELRKLSAGDGGRGGLNLQLVGNLLIPLPPLPEQKKIVEILSTWDRAIEKTEKLIVAKNKLKKGLMQQLLTGRKRFKEFEKDKWSYVFIKDILKEVNRPIEWDEAKLYPLISVRRRSGGLFYRESLYGYQIKTKNLKTARAGDFLISKMQVVHGAMGLTSEEFDSMYISDSYISLIPCDEKKLNIDFFNYLSQMRHMYYIALVSSTGVHIEKMTFDLNDFLHHKVFIPENIKEQHRIASVLSSIDNEISVLNKKLNAIKRQKKGLMQKLLTGEVRVRV